MDVAELLAKYEIHELLMRCLGAFDREDWDVVRESFHPGAQHDHGTWKGSIDELIEREKVTYQGFSGNFHFSGNEQIWLDGDSARSEMYSVCWHRTRGDAKRSPEDLVAGMRYLDQHERRDGVWRIADRVVVIDWYRSDPVTSPDWPRVLGSHAGGSR